MSFVWGVSTLLQLLSVGINTPIVWTLWRRRRPTPPYFVLSICLSHLISSLIGLSEVWLGSFLVLVSNLVVSVASLQTLALIAAERYITIKRPMECKSILTQKRCLLTLSLVWITSAFIVIPPSLLLQKMEIGWRIFFGLTQLFLTIFTLTVMTLCYQTIYTIAKEKCRKVKLGEFRRRSSEISSEGPTSVNITTAPPLPRGISSHSLLQWVLLNNRLLKPPLFSSPPEETICTVSAPTSPNPAASNDLVLRRAKRRWRAYLRHNYNSPKKTIATILTLIGSVVVVSLPPALSLLIYPSAFITIQSLLFSLSSNLHPLLYALLNRNIRHHLLQKSRPALPRSLRRKPTHNRPNRKMKRKVSDVGIPGLGSCRVVPSTLYRVRPPIPVIVRRPSLTATSEEDEEQNGNEMNSSIGRLLDQDRIDQQNVVIHVHFPRDPLNPEEISNDPNEEPGIEEEEVNLPVNLPRKPSQDSGADMNYNSEDEDYEDDHHIPPAPSPFIISPRGSLRDFVRIISMRKSSSTSTLPLLRVPVPGPYSISTDTGLDRRSREGNFLLEVNSLPQTARSVGRINYID